MRGTTATGERGQRIFLAGQPAGTRREAHRGLYPGREFGTLVESWRTVAHASNRCHTSPHATEVARPSRARDLPAAQSDCRTRERSVERATRHAAVSYAGTRQGRRGMDASHHRLQPDAPMARQPAATVPSKKRRSPLTAPGRSRTKKVRPRKSRVFTQTLKP